MRQTRPEHAARRTISGLSVVSESVDGLGELINRHRVGVAFPEGLELLPFYENLAKGQLLPFYAHFLSVTFTVLPQTHTFFIGVLRVPPPPATAVV